MKPKKRLGQHFLRDQKVVLDLVRAGEINPKDTVVEVGAGTGVVTRELAERAGKILAVEFDRDLIPQLRENLKSFQNVKIVHKDILDLRFANYDLRDFKVVGSIPYQITSPLVHKLLTKKPRPNLIALLIQKEVAEKFVAKPPKATYLSNFVQAFGKVKITRHVPPSAFFPQPKVTSSIIRIVPEKNVYGIDPQKFSAFLHQAFKHPRKMLRNIFPEERLKKAGIDPEARAQEIPLEKWIKLHHALNPDIL